MKKKLYFAQLNSSKTGVEFTTRQAIIGDSWIKYVDDGGYTHILFHVALGEPRRDFGIGLTPEDALKSFQDGKIEEAEDLEAKAQELRHIASLGADACRI